MLDGLSVTLPLPEYAGDLLTFHGRHAREFQPYRRPWPSGAVLAENWRGRTSHEHPSLLFAGTVGFGEWQGEVWGVHLAWSGNHDVVAERLPDGRRIVQLGELLHPGEVALEPGESYSTPEVVAVHSADGLTPATWGFHRHLRGRPGHPTTPRPVLLNTWEAVYFDHDTERLCALATAAAGVGIERFVLDDGWFGSRRDDTKGLGDWWVSPEMYPDGLGPLIAHVRSLGMEFGIWVEPEMVNPDSDLYRAHPEWALTTEGYEPVLGRNQLVLDLANPDAYAYVYERLDALLRDHDIAFVKWDMNRDHIQGSGRRRRGRHARPDARAVSTARRARRGPSRCRDRELLVGWGADRSRDPAAHRSCLDERLQRRPRAPDDPAWGLDADRARADGCPHRPAHVAHDRPDAHARVPRRDRDVRPPRRRVERARARRRRDRAAPRGDRPAQAASARCSTPATRSGSTSRSRTWRTACTRATGRRR